MQQYDPNTQAPEILRSTFKRWQKSTVDEISKSHDILDLDRSDYLDRVAELTYLSCWERNIHDVVDSFLMTENQDSERIVKDALPTPPRAFEVKDLPGAQE